jgi:2-polyprenyl-3-methyl-5-hydroxy-6-metoxy-1,4-benzoquinol methylase
MFDHARKERLCPICDSESYDVMARARVIENDPVLLFAATDGIRHTQRLVCCLDCGHIYENPAFDECAMLVGYAGAVNSTHDSQFDCRVATFRQALKRTEDVVPWRSKAVLDVGCAGGAFLLAAIQHGSVGVGIEPSGKLAAAAAARGLNVVEGTLGTALESGQISAGLSKSFGIATYWDVLEHVYDPRLELARVKSVLSEDSYLVLNLPDIESRSARFAGHRYWWKTSVHIHHFTRTSLARILHRSGFSLVAERRYWQQLEFGYLAMTAASLGVPGAAFVHRWTPSKLSALRLRYSAAQTTFIAKSR